MPILGSKGGGAESSYRGELDDYPNIFTFTNLDNVAPGTTYTSNLVTLSDLNYRAKVSIVGTGASFSINGGNYISTIGYVRNNDTIRLAITPPNTFIPTDFERISTAILNVGRSSYSWDVKTREMSKDPNPFAFTEVFNVPISEERISNYITLSGIESNLFTPAAITTDLGLLRINGNPGVSTANVFNGDEIALIKPRLSDIPSNYTTPVNIGVVIGEFSTTWTINPLEADLTPNNFTFNDVSSINIGTVITSNSITVSGINNTAIPKFTVPISVSSSSNVSFSYNINGGIYRTTPGAVINGDVITIKATTPSLYETSISAIVTIGGVSSSWNITTKSAPFNTIPNQFIFNDIGNNSQLDTLLTSNDITLTGISNNKSGVAYIADGAGRFRVTRNNSVVRNYSSAATTVQNNDVITLRLLSPKDYGQIINTTFAVSGVDFNGISGTQSDNWQISNYLSQFDPIVKFSVGSDPNAAILNKNITLGESVTLSWAVTSPSEIITTRVSINQGIGVVPLAGSITVTPTMATKYVLTATGITGSVSQDITGSVSQGISIVIPPTPIITSFYISPSPIPVGSTATLTWSISNLATSVSIDRGIGNVTGESSYTITPTTSTTYTITAIGPGGTATRTATVQVVTSPFITFSGSPLNLTTGNSSTLSWNVIGGDTISIDQGIGSVGASGTRVVRPTTTTKYTLTSTNTSGTEVATVTLNPSPLPVINSFTLTPSDISVGSNSALSWDVSGATSLFINNGIGAVSNSGSRNVNPSSSTTYRLTATNAAGDSTTSEVTLTVNGPPTVNFTASPTNINVGESSKLTWKTTNTIRVNIFGVITNGPPNGSANVSPSDTTTYNITAFGPGGSTSKSTRVVVVACAETNFINYLYGAGSCGNCSSNNCYGKYWKCVDGFYYGNVNQMAGVVKNANTEHFTACGRYIRSEEIDLEVIRYQQLGTNYSYSVRTRKLSTTQAKTLCGNDVTSLPGSAYCAG